MAGSMDNLEVRVEERNVMRECRREAFWYRSLPAALLTGEVLANLKLCRSHDFTQCFSGFSVNYAIHDRDRKSSFRQRRQVKFIWKLKMKHVIKTGKIRMIRHGFLPIIAGASSLAYFDYIFGKNCGDKLLEAPRSEMSEQIRKTRDGDKMCVEVDWESVSISKWESQIMRDCHSVAFWKFSMPLMILIPGALYLVPRKSCTINKGMLGSSNPVCASVYGQDLAIAICNLSNNLMPKARNMLFGASVGYVAGQFLYYLYSNDCSNRFLQFARNDNIARVLRPKSE